jgi:hypothetical protein
LERSQGAVDDEKGTQWGIFSQLNYAGSNSYPRLWATYDHGYLLPLKNSSAWVRSSVGKSFGDQTNPIAKFYFGGFGNNYVDHGSIDRYREYYSFPGLRLDEIPGSSFAKITGEWDLPPVRFRKLGTTWLYSNWTRLSMFSSGMSTNLGNAQRRQFYTDVGTQVNIRLVFFTYLNTTLSLGYAGASDQHGRLSKGYVISLKLL